MKAKRLIAPVALLSLLVGVLFFCVFPWIIGAPTAATIRYWCDSTQEYHELTLTKPQTEKLIRILRSATPTVFFCPDTPGINSEDVLITLSYSDGTEKEFSLYSNRTTLYEGNAENLTMACMLGQCFHFGGSLSADMETYLQEVCSEPPQAPAAGE